MAAPKKLGKPVYVTTVLEEYQHDALKDIAYKKRKPMAELIREALSIMITKEASREKGTKNTAR